MEIKLLSCLSKEQRKFVKGLSIKKGYSLFKEGDTCDSIGIVVSGEIDIISYSIEGKEIVYNSITPGHLFGANLVFSSEREYKGNVIAKEKSTVAIIKKADLINILQTNQEFLLEYLNKVSDFSKALNSKIKVLSYESSEDRFMVYLGMNDNQITMKSVTDLAATLCMTRESLSRCLSRLEKKHLIKRKGNTIKRS